MKKSLIILFAALLLSSVCFAEQASVNVPSTQAKVTDNKKQANDKKDVTPKVKKANKKIQKTAEPVVK
jgi:hypothetical protein